MTDTRPSQQPEAARDARVPEWEVQVATSLTVAAWAPIAVLAWHAAHWYGLTAVVLFGGLRAAWFIRLGLRPHHGAEQPTENGPSEGTQP